MVCRILREGVGGRGVCGKKHRNNMRCKTRKDVVEHRDHRPVCDGDVIGPSTQLQQRHLVVSPDLVKLFLLCTNKTQSGVFNPLNLITCVTCTGSCFLTCMFVCLPVCEQDISRSRGWIWMELGGAVGCVTRTK